MRQTLLTFLLALLPLVASADYSGSCGNGVTYSYLESTHTLTISGDGAMETEHQDTPWYSYRDDIQTVIIEEGVISIGEYAFLECSNLTSVTIPSSVTLIGGAAFRDCSSLTTLTIPISVTSIGDEAFSGTAWYNNLPDGLVYAGKVAYKYKGAMPSNTSIVLEEGTIEVAYGAFSGCVGLVSITLPNSVIRIEKGAFDGCTGLTNVSLSNSLVSIGYSVFFGCTALTSIIIPQSVTSIMGGAFNDCSSLANITIPNSVTYIGKYAFYDTSWYKNQPDGVVYAGKVAYSYKGEMPSNTSIVLEEGTKGIAESAFAECNKLTNITIPNTVTTIGRDAFESCI